MLCRQWVADSSSCWRADLLPDRMPGTGRLPIFTGGSFLLACIAMLTRSTETAHVTAVLNLETI